MPSTSVHTYERDLHEAFVEENGPEAEARLGTVDLVLYLKDRFPELDFSFMMGWDTFSDLVQGKWKRSEELIEATTSFVVLWREDLALDASLEAKGREYGEGKFLFFDFHTDMSSSQVRDVRWSWALKTMVQAEVADYIEQEELFLFSPERKAAFWRWALTGLSFLSLSLFSVWWRRAR